MLSYSDITSGRYIVLDNEPYEVLSNQISKKSRQKASNQTKLRSLKTGKVTEKAFHQSDSVEEAEILKEDAVFLYHNRGEYWFHEEGDKSARFALSDELLGNKGQYLKENTTITILRFNEDIIGVDLPIKIDLLVSEAPPAVRGNTAQGGNKQVVLETGTIVSTPLFINKGDIVRINTETGQYVERVKKA